MQMIAICISYLQIYKKTIFLKQFEFYLIYDTQLSTLIKQITQYSCGRIVTTKVVNTYNEGHSVERNMVHIRYWVNIIYIDL